MNEFIVLWCMKDDCNEMQYQKWMHCSHSHWNANQFASLLSPFRPKSFSVWFCTYWLHKYLEYTYIEVYYYYIYAWIKTQTRTEKAFCQSFESNQYRLASKSSICDASKPCERQIVCKINKTQNLDSWELFIGYL